MAERNDNSRSARPEPPSVPCSRAHLRGNHIFVRLLRSVASSHVLARQSPLYRRIARNRNPPEAETQYFRDEMHIARRRLCHSVPAPITPADHGPAANDLVRNRIVVAPLTQSSPAHPLLASAPGATGRALPEPQATHSLGCNGTSASGNASPVFACSGPDSSDPRSKAAQDMFPNCRATESPRRRVDAAAPSTPASADIAKGCPLRATQPPGY